jgi:hypothetical protein
MGKIIASYFDPITKKRVDIAIDKIEVTSTGKVKSPPDKPEEINISPQAGLRPDGTTVFQQAPGFGHSRDLKPISPERNVFKPTKGSTQP